MSFGVGRVFCDLAEVVSQTEQHVGFLSSADDLSSRSSYRFEHEHNTKITTAIKYLNLKETVHKICSY